MTDENTNENVTLEQVQEQLKKALEANQSLQQQFESVKNKSDELLTETKAAKQRAREAAEAREAAKLEKARKDGDYEQLLQSSEKERETLKKQLEELSNKVSTEKVTNTSLAIAAELADGNNAKLLSEFISKRIKFVDGEIKVLDSSGNLTVSKLEDLKTEFSTSEMFKSLIRGTKSTGGGASGSKAVGDSSKEINRETFDRMNPQQKMEFATKGGKVTD